MEQELPLFPESASTLAPQVDALFLAWSAISIAFTILIAALIVYFMVRYRRQSVDEVGQAERAPAWLEIAWSVIPLIISLAMFAWGAQVFFEIYRAPKNAVEYWAVGKQWMWKFQHPDGHREINTLHVPVGVPVRLHIQSEDVIHSVYIPAFRIKQDAVPGRETSAWFQATKPGTYHLFCAEYCGGEHSKMTGTIVAMEPEDYQVWLAGGPVGKSMMASGADLFESLACYTCHRPATEAGTAAAAGMAARAPRLEGLYGSQVKLIDGRSVIADEEYLRESILNPAEKIVSGWQPIMPTYQGQVTEEQLSQLLAYIRSLSATTGASAAVAPAVAAEPVQNPVPDTAPNPAPRTQGQ